MKSASLTAICLLAATGIVYGQPAPGPSAYTGDAAILYFAYQLEWFEANVYSCASTGQPISRDLSGGGPVVSNCTKANFSNSTVASLVAELAREELAHTQLLYSSLRAAGLSPVAPAIDINSAFTAAATAANSQLSSFNAYANDLFFLHASFLFEDLGTSAYLGALASITTPAYKLVAAQIGNAEAYHSSLVRTILYQNLNVTAVPGFTVKAITDAIVAVLNTLTGTPQLKYGIYNNQGASVANVDSNGLVPYASVKQVLSAVTLGAPSGSGGGFFPSNLNGALKN